jgi:hypothetical protein
MQVVPVEATSSQVETTFEKLQRGTPSGLVSVVLLHGFLELGGDQSTH